MTRSVWKGPFVDPSLIKSRQIKGTPARAARRVDDSRGETRDYVYRKVWSRRSCILPQFVGRSMQIYNGRKWIGLKITEEMVGHKFGEFATTRTLGGRRPAEKRSNSKARRL